MIKIIVQLEFEQDSSDISPTIDYVKDLLSHENIDYKILRQWIELYYPE